MHRHCVRRLATWLTGFAARFATHGGYLSAAGLSAKAVTERTRVTLDGKEGFGKWV